MRELEKDEIRYGGANARAAAHLPYQVPYVGSFGQKGEDKKPTEINEAWIPAVRLRLIC